MWQFWETKKGGHVLQEDIFLWCCILYITFSVQAFEPLTLWAQGEIMQAMEAMGLPGSLRSENEKISQIQVLQL